MDNSQQQNTGIPKPVAMFSKAEGSKCLMCKFVLAFSFIVLLLVLTLTVLLKLEPFADSVNSQLNERAPIGD